MRSKASIVSVFFAATIAGCAVQRAKEPSSPQKEASPSPPPQSPDASGIGPTSTGAGTAAPPSVPGATGAATPTIVDDLGRAQKQFDESAMAFKASGSDCMSLCKALASMQRAAEHLCEWVKDGGDLDQKRCTDARARVASAKEKVASTCGASCGS